MPTLLETSTELAKTFVQSKNKKVAAKCIANHINCLQYSDTKEPIDFQTKTVIVQVVGELISGIRPIGLYGNETMLITSKDVLSFDKLSDKILEMVQPDHVEEEIEINFKRSGTLLHTFSLSFYNVNNYVSEIGKYFKIKKQQ